jgi:hypothetical protein
MILCSVSAFVYTITVPDNDYSLRTIQRWLLRSLILNWVLLL